MEATGGWGQGGTGTLQIPPQASGGWKDVLRLRVDLTRTSQTDLEDPPLRTKLSVADGLLDVNLSRPWATWFQRVGSIFKSAATFAKNLCVLGWVGIGTRNPAIHGQTGADPVLNIHNDLGSGYPGIILSTSQTGINSVPGIITWSTPNTTGTEKRSAYIYVLNTADAATAVTAQMVFGTTIANTISNKMIITGAGDVRIGSASHYTNLDSTGHQTMVGTAQPWDDLRIEPVARGTGANNPAFEQYLTNGAGSVGVFLYSFTDVAAAQEKEVYFTMQLPHDWNQSTIYMHVHWIGSADDTTAAPRWGLEYTWAEPGAVFPNTLIVYTDGSNYIEGGTDANVTANKHYLSKFAAITPSSSQNGLSSILIGRLFRNSSDAGDTYNVATNKCGLLYVDAHYQRNSIGSDQEYVK